MTMKTRGHRPSSPVPAARRCAGDGVEAIRNDILEKLFCNQAKFPEVASRNDFYLALASAIRDQVLRRWINSAHTYFERESRTVVYLSAEYLMGPQLGNNLINLGLYDQAAAAVRKLGLSLDDLLEQEEEPGLGNGGLGRLAACYMDSLATLGIPTIGYGIRYEFGIFDQKIHDGWQVEVTDRWLRKGNPWEIPHPEAEYCVKLGGRTETYEDEKGKRRVRWVPDRLTRGSPYDTPVLGYRVNNANILRLWKADACESFDLEAFNTGNYYRAVEQKVASENISRILYPTDQALAGKELRLEQEYFFVSCSLQDLIRIYLQREDTLDRFHKKYVIQMNDTHPAIAVAELMRLLVDEYEMEWSKAWNITTHTFAYTNHTLLAEALEKWPLPLFARLLPRHMEIIFEINQRFLDTVRQEYHGDEERAARLSIIQEGPEKQVRMANLACVGSQAINGVAALHTELLKRTTLKDVYDLWPKKFTNKTNGVTPRRFVALCNPGLTRLIGDAIGDGWIRDLDELRKLEPFVRDAEFRDRWRKVKAANKQALAGFVSRTVGVAVDPESMFDVQVKRIHEYKRQHLNVLHVITLYNRLKRGWRGVITPRTFIFGGKAAPGYTMAKLMIKLINSVADVINSDRTVREFLRVVFIPDFNVKNAQRIYPAADLSEQISTAGKEASGTGNMKFALNGALTMGTLDGANIEIREEVGEENFFLFGLTAEEVMRRKAEGYRPGDLIQENPELRDVIELIDSGLFSKWDKTLFAPLTGALKERDDFMLLADYASYVECQRTAGNVYRDEAAWTRMSILNVARMGKFSSDRSIREYARDIWHVSPVHVELSRGL